MAKEFKNKFGHKYSDNNEEDVKNISNMVNENSEKYLKLYQDALGDRMEVTFIKNEYYN